MTSNGEQNLTGSVSFDHAIPNDTIRIVSRKHCCLCHRLTKHLYHVWLSRTCLFAPQTGRLRRKLRLEIWSQQIRRLLFVVHSFLRARGLCPRRSVLASEPVIPSVINALRGTIDGQSRLSYKSEKVLLLHGDPMPTFTSVHSSKPLHNLHFAFSAGPP